MSDELKGILDQYFSKPFSIYGEKALEEITEKIRQLYIRERKEWARKLVKEARRKVYNKACGGMLPTSYYTGLNDLKTEICKKIEEE